MNTRIVLCLAFAILFVNIAFDLISCASTLLNVVGLILLCVVVTITIKTKIFTTFKSHKNEKNN